MRPPMKDVGTHGIGRETYSHNLGLCLVDEPTTPLLAGDGPRERELQRTDG